MADQEAAGRPWRILIADDEPQNIGLLRKRLQVAGHEVLAAGSGLEAVAVARLERPDLLLLDVMMPDLDGFGVLARLRSEEETAQIPVIFVSADHDYDRRVQALVQGGHDYITKPFHPGELLARVQAALRTKAIYDRLQQQRRQLDEMTRRDALTNIYNRRHLDEVLHREFHRHGEWLSPLSVVLIDLDHFKLVNDTHGHSVGDGVLCEVASLMRSRVRETDILGRFGGEEFMVILPATPLGGAVALAEALREMVSEHRFACCPHSRITCSAGVATAWAEQPVPTPEALVIIADSRLYDAKRAGRNRVEPGGAHL